MQTTEFDTTILRNHFLIKGGGGQKPNLTACVIVFGKDQAKKSTVEDDITKIQKLFSAGVKVC